MARRIALLCFGLIALVEIVDVIGYLLLLQDPDALAEAGARLRLDGDLMYRRSGMLAAIGTAILAMSLLVVVGLWRRTPRAVRWARTTSLATGLYALWTAAQPRLLGGLDADVATPFLVRGLALLLVATVGNLVARRATALEEIMDEDFSVEVPGYETEVNSTGLRWQDIEVGTGPLASPGRTAVVHYTGWLTNGRKFDSSRDRGQPFDFKVGEGRVIKGWDTGVATMRQGGRRRLVIPPELGYGARGVGPIPADAQLVFDIELIDVK